MKDDRRIKALEMIAADMKNNAKNFDGHPFNGKAVIDGHETELAQCHDLLQETERKNKMLKERLEGANAGRPLGPIMGAQQIVELKTENNALWKKNSTLRTENRKLREVLKQAKEVINNIIYFQS